MGAKTFPSKKRKLEHIHKRVEALVLNYDTGKTDIMNFLSGMAHNVAIYIPSLVLLIIFCSNSCVSFLFFVLCFFGRKKTNFKLKGYLIFCRDASLQPPGVRLRNLT